ncbi:MULTISPECIES: ABC transporter ATP-binding protein [unclassified Lactococcus]|uniref:ABC transporter ATP-binding protein n=1 Tax=unclassified Lactococcus TaxID=2643510 RepID=UPI0011C91383|nr:MULTISPECIES: betaine/proline/choline family ABC transporter ATP-binding protein [unclassified Lactococcus]MQW23616.1 betaine/proline/choline family ABC transporter ATP-binding protein [Lactococcus sp. dk101]TXK37645.1 betaine/proline/choline family ABC transporter ATP-binding protein [Lactococcus sp. dk310]TXK49083.1 betaine/proline/choline family ABC transporter ATP-binding protein [Lactococcus sp. dk322]
MTQAIIEFKDIEKLYGDNVAVEKINLKIMPGDFICFIGTSGSGKSTLLRMINRMIEPTHGDILFNGENIKRFNPIELRRKIGYVIQSIGLMPHMSIYDNVTLVPKLLKWKESRKKEKAKKLIQMVELPEEYLDRYPSELSGGQQQRIGVIRALAADQNIILMDEPFGALDPITRDGVQNTVKYLQEELGKTIVLVTHDMDEALKLATRIVVMDSGKMVQQGTPEEILKNPANEFVEKMIGSERLISAQANNSCVKDIMLSHPITVAKGTRLIDAAHKMKESHVDSLLVTEAGQLVGKIDIDQFTKSLNKNILVEDLMVKVPFTVDENDSLRDVVAPILKGGVKFVPVTDDKNQVKGIITRSSLVSLIYGIVWGESND